MLSVCGFVYALRNKCMQFCLHVCMFVYVCANVCMSLCKCAHAPVLVFMHMCTRWPGQSKYFTHHTYLLLLHSVMYSPVNVTDVGFFTASEHHSADGLNSETESKYKLCFHQLLLKLTWVHQMPKKGVQPPEGDGKCLYIFSFIYNNMQSKQIIFMYLYLIQWLV